MTCLHQPLHIGGECNHCMAKRIIATPNAAFNSGDVLVLPDGEKRVIAADVDETVSEWKSAWRKEL